MDKALELRMREKELARQTEEVICQATNTYLYDMIPEYHSPHYRGKGHSTKYANNNSSLAHTKKRKAKRRLNKRHNK